MRRKTIDPLWECLPAGNIYFHKNFVTVMGERLWYFCGRPVPVDKGGLNVTRLISISAKGVGRGEVDENRRLIGNGKDNHSGDFLDSGRNENYYIALGLVGFVNESVVPKRGIVSIPILKLEYLIMIAIIIGFPHRRRSLSKIIIKPQPQRIARSIVVGAHDGRKPHPGKNQFMDVAAFIVQDGLAGGA